MENTDINRVTGIGISQDLPDTVTYFQEISLLEELVVPQQKPSIESIVSVVTGVNVERYKLIETPIAVSYEGQNLSGQKLIIELSFYQKVKYVADSNCQSIHAFSDNSLIKSVFVIVPCEINGERVCDLIRKKKFSITPYIEDLYSIKRDSKVILNYVTLIVDIKFF